MTRDEIIRMARAAGAYAPKYPIGPHDVQFSFASLERFARIVAGAEREACAEVVEEWLHGKWQLHGAVAAAMIRARGEL